MGEDNQEAEASYLSLMLVLGKGLFYSCPTVHGAWVLCKLTVLGIVTCSEHGRC